MTTQHFAITKDAPGRMVKTAQGVWAFVPDALPPAFDLSWVLVSQLSAADRALAELAGVGQTLPNPHLLIGPFLRREAVLSSRIEGTQASLSDLFFFEAAPAQHKEPRDVREVANYVSALEYGIERLHTLPLSLRLFRELHKRLLTGVRGAETTPGEFRRDQNWIGPEGCRIEEANYIPPPSTEMKAALGALEKFLHERHHLPALIRFALVHYQFEAIHPFRDGNGRIGRLLVTLNLCAERLLTQPLLYLSAFFEQRRAEYYQRLLAVTQSGAWVEWISFFLEGVEQQSRDAIDRAHRLLGLHKQLRERLQSARTSALSLRLVDELFSYPAITMRRASQLLRVTPRAAQLNIDKLIEAGIVEEVTGGMRNRVYVARPIVDVIEGSVSP